MIERPPGVKAKIVRAEKHLTALRHEVRRYEKRDPYVVHAEFQEDPPGYRAVARLRKPLPLSIACIAGDLIQNLRAALDHLARGLVLSNCGKPVDDRRDGRQTSFPIVADEKVDREAIVIAGGVHEDALAEVQRLQPLGRWNDPLARLGELSNTDKHRLLLPVVLALADTFALTLVRGDRRDVNLRGAPATAVVTAVPGIVSGTVFVPREAPTAPASVPPPPRRRSAGGLRCFEDQAPVSFFPSTERFEGEVKVEGKVGVFVTISKVAAGREVRELTIDLEHLLTHVRDYVVPRFDAFFSAVD